MLFGKCTIHHFAFMEDYISICFRWPKEIQRGFSLLPKNGKGENSIQCLFCSEMRGCPRGSTHPEQGEWPPKLLPWKLHPASQHPAATALNRICDYLWFISTYPIQPLARCVLRYQKSPKELIFSRSGNAQNFSHIHEWSLLLWFMPFQLTKVFKGMLYFQIVGGTW